MSFVSNQFKIDDYVICKEDITTPIYKVTFPKGHEFKVLDIEKTGLVLEDISDGLIIKNEGFLRFKRVARRSTYRNGVQDGWLNNTSAGDGYTRYYDDDKDLD